MAKKSPGMQEQLQECALRFVTEVLNIISTASLDDLALLRADVRETVQRAKTTKPVATKPARRTRTKKPATRVKKIEAAPAIVPQPVSTASGRRDTTLISGRRPPELSFAPTLTAADSEPPAATRQPKVQPAYIREVPEGDATRYIVQSETGTEIASSLQRREAVRDASDKGFTIISLAPPPSPSGPSANNPA